MPVYKNRSGRFCSGAYKRNTAIISKANKRRWQAYRDSELQSHTNTEHNYAQTGTSTVSDVENIACAGFDVTEEILQSVQDLPKNAVSIGKFRLIVELQHIINQLMDGCSNCKVPLNICGAKGVQTWGLGGWIYICCDNSACSQINRISLGKQHRDPTVQKDNEYNVLPHGNAIFDINTKTASGMLHAGIGETHINNLLTTMNLPHISHTSLKKRENEISSVLEKFAKGSADSALETEKELTKENHEHGEIPGIEVSVDSAWQKRGSQRSYNSLSGFTSTIGKQTKKIVHFNSRIKRCHTCMRASHTKRSPPGHRCNVNWHGSAKAMEPDMFVEMIQDSTSKGVKIAKVAGDDDNTGINKIQKDGNVDIIKESDKNHVRKNISKKLYALVPKHKSLTKKVISAVTKNYNYMLQQNQGKPEQIVTGLKAVVEHMFGNHTYCQNWCGYLKDPEKYKHGNLPYGRDLCDEALHTALSELFGSLDTNKLAFLSSTQANESFNNIVASKAPKGRHYSESSSLKYRLCASVG